MGYKITKIYSADSYKRKRGLFKEYVEFFYKMKLCNSKHLSQKECDEYNKKNLIMGLNITIKPDETQCNSGLKKWLTIC